MSANLYDGVKKIAQDVQEAEIQYGYITSVTDQTVGVRIASSKSSFIVDRPAGFYGMRGDECTLARNKRTGLWEIVSVKNTAGLVSGSSSSGGGGAMKLITSGTLASPQTEVNFNNIPSSYEMLLVKLDLKTSYNAGASHIGIRFNNDTNANYSNQHFWASQAASAAAQDYNLTYGIIRYALQGSANPSQFRSISELTFYNYADTSNYKLYTWRAFTFLTNTVGMYHINGSGAWRNTTSAINSMNFFIYNSLGEFTSGCSYAMYGIES